MASVTITYAVHLALEYSYQL